MPLLRPAEHPPPADAAAAPQTAAAAAPLTAAVAVPPAAVPVAQREAGTLPLQPPPSPLLPLQQQLGFRHRSLRCLPILCHTAKVRRTTPPSQLAPLCEHVKQLKMSLANGRRVQAVS